jgi:hypothetical protein
MAATSAASVLKPRVSGSASPWLMRGAAGVAGEDAAILVNCRQTPTRAMR